MQDHAFDVDAWLRRIRYDAPREPVFGTLRGVIAAHTATIPFENIDVLLGRPPKLDLVSLQRKMIAGGRGGYCFEQNTLLLGGLCALGFRVTGLIARVIRGMEATPQGRRHTCCCEWICQRDRSSPMSASAIRPPRHRWLCVRGWNRKPT